MAGAIATKRPLRLSDYRYHGELISLVLTFSILTSLYALAAIFFTDTWWSTLKTLMVTLAGLIVYFVTVKLQQRSAFGTLVRTSPRQFPEIYELARVAAERLSTDQVPVYVKRQSEMNVYTLGFRKKQLIVLTSSLVDQMEPDSLQFFIGREIGHIRAGHTWLRTLLRPLGSEVPIIGRLLNSVVFGDWMNRAEFTADRAGFIACRSLTTSVSTMLKYGIGIKLYQKLDIKEFLGQIDEVRNLSGHITEIVAEQPYLTQRVRSLVSYALSDRFRSLAPDKPGYTKILESMPPAFVSPKFNLADFGSGSERNANSKAEVATIVDQVLTDVDEFAEVDQRENCPDPRLTLVAAEGDSTYILRRYCTRIGRNHDNDIVIDSDRVSRHHAEIMREGNEIRILDKGSRNGVWVNGKKIAESAVIRSGDVIVVGRRKFTFTEKN
jgi:Zn-dependent protease with chaperone function